MMNRLYTACQWVVRLATVNLLWAGFSVVGGIVLGLFPATVAMFSVTRRWLDGDPDVSVWRHFTACYRKEFGAANRFGWPILLCGALFAIDLFLVVESERLLLRVTGFVVLVLALAYLLVLPYAFPVFSHFALGAQHLVKLTVLLGLGRPLGGLMAWIGIAGCGLVFLQLPGLLPFFGVSAPSLWVTWVTRRYLTRASRPRPSQGTSVAETQRQA